MENGYKIQKEKSDYWNEYNEKKARIFLSFAEEIVGGPIFYGNAGTPLERVSYLLEHLKGEALIPTLSFYFKEYGLEEEGLVLELLQILSKYPYGNRTTSMMDVYRNIPMVDKIYPKVYGFEIRTKNGTITVYRALEFLKRLETVLKNYHVIRKDDVSLRLVLLRSYFPEDIVVDCLMPQMFGSFSYETYIKLKEEKGYLDLRHDCFYPEDAFEEYFQPKILEKRKGKDLKTDIPPYEIENKHISSRGRK